MFTTELTTEMGQYVRMAYQADEDLVRKWHIIAGSSPDECIAKTIDDLEQCETLKFYTVFEDEKFIGYFGTELDGKYMPTIFIMPEYRNRKSEFWNEIGQKVTTNFLAGIYSKNIPCMRFYLKMGGKEMGREKASDGEIAVFKFNQVGV